MNHPREPFDRLFDRFNEDFRRVADQECFVFETTAGPNIGRALRVKEPLHKGVFLELKKHWTDSDLTDPEVILGYGVWLRPKDSHFPVYFLRKVFYEGKLQGLNDTIEKYLRLAVSEVKMVTEEIVRRDGKFFEDWPKEGEAI